MSNVKVKYAYLDEQFSDFDSFLPHLRELVASGEFTLGPYVDRFEKKFASYIGCKHVIGTNTGTDALILALQACGVGPGDEVITVANTFYATAGAIVAAGAKPVFVDSDDRYQIDVKKIESAITPKTKVILPVHWAGCPAEMDKVLQIAKTHRLKVVEDACPAAGASIQGQRVGTFGDVNGFSMHPLKPLNVWGDGGMVTTNNDEANDWLRLYHNHGLVDREHIDFWGVNKRLQPIQAMVATRVLDTIEDSNEKRIRNARLLDQGLTQGRLREFVTVPPRLTGYREVYQLYLVSVQKRDEFVKYMVNEGIEVKVHYPIPLHLQKAADNLGYKKGDFPVAEKQADEVVTLPAHQFITPEQIEFIVNRMESFYGKV